MIEGAAIVLDIGLALTVWCSPERDAILWHVVPGAIHRSIWRLTGYYISRKIRRSGTTYRWVRGARIPIVRRKSY